MQYGNIEIYNKRTQGGGRCKEYKRKGIPCTITKEFILDLWNKQNGCWKSLYQYKHRLD